MRLQCEMNILIKPSAWIVFAASLIGCAHRSLPPVTFPKIPKDPLPGIFAKALQTEHSTDGVEPKRISKFVIGLGSGLHGFTSIELRDGGHVALVLDDPTKKNRFVRATSVHPVPGVAELLASRSLTQCIKLGRRYTDGLSDGTQAFLSVQDGHVKRFTYCDNVFPDGFERAWIDVCAFIESQPRSTWRTHGNANPFRHYMESKANSQ
jgi:hypothetical protein